MPALLAEVTGYAQAFIAIVFNGFDLVQAYGNALPETLVSLGFTRGGASHLRLVQNILGDLFQLIDAIRKTICGHGYFLTTDERLVKSGYHSNFDRPGRCPSPTREQYGRR